MTDNTRLNPGSSGDLMSTDSLGGSPEVKVQNVKIQYGASGTATDVSAASPLPVDSSSPVSLLWQTYDADISSSTATLDFNTDIGQNARYFFFEVDGVVGADDRVTIAISNDGVTFSDQWEMRENATIAVDSVSVDSLLVTWVQGTVSYRCLAY